MTGEIQPFPPLLGAETLKKHTSLHHLFLPSMLPHSMRPKLWTDTISCDNADREVDFVATAGLLPCHSSECEETQFLLCD